MSRTAFFLAASTLLPATFAQAPTAVNGTAATGTVVPDQFIVTFAERSFDLEAYRAAIYARRPAAEVEQIVRSLDAAMERDQASFVRTVTDLGGTVLHQYWIINAAAVRLPHGAAILPALPNVKQVTQDRIWMPWLDVATNQQHHAGDQANQRMVNGVPVKGRGQTVAILDTGIDFNMNGLNRPHAAFYPQGNTSLNGGGLQGSYIKGQFDASGSWGTEDRNGHGTFVAGCSSANRWISSASADDGFAPEAFLYAINVSSASNGGASGAAIANAWQHVAAQRAAHNISVANNSYSGSPNMSDPVQLALDNVASTSNVLVCVAAGNSATNTSNSQSAYNGLAVGALEKNSLAVASFSCTGPLNGSNRSYPDISAVGAAVHSLQPDGESVVATSSGTSFASPMLAGTAALVRQADTTLTSLETKAILLNTTNAAAGRNQFGLGIMRADNAVDSALAHEVLTTRLTSAQPRKHLRIVSAGGQENITATWFRTTAGHENIDIEAYQANGNPLGADLNTENAYGKLSFVSNGPANYRTVIYLVTPGSGKSLDVAVAGHVEVMDPPVVTNLTPASIPAHQPPQVTVTGTDLDFVTSITLGGLPVTSFTSVSPTQLVFQPPAGLAIGTPNLVITTEVGAAAPVQLPVTGTHPVTIDGPNLIPRGTSGAFTLYGDSNWLSVLLLSNSNFPSQLPGIVDLEIGNFFLSLWEIGTFAHDSQGVVQFSIPIHRQFPRFQFYFEVITLDPTNITYPLETSSAHPWQAQ
ncbi:MAG: S8 family serine peptidase [Planctomycetota bacterium]